MAKVTQSDIKIINDLYYELKTYAAVARKTGFGASTVKKYVIPNYVPTSEEDYKHFYVDDLPSDFEKIEEQFKNIENYGDLFVMSDEELDEIKELWKEIDV